MNDPFFIVKQNNTQQICRHILWVYLFGLDIPEDSRLINQVALVDCEVLELTSNPSPAVISPRLFRQSSTTSGSFTHNTNLSDSDMPSTSTANVSSSKVPKMTNDEINGLFEGSPLNAAPQVWTILKETGKGKQPSCAGYTSSKIQSGRICIHLSGLYVP